MEFKDTRFNRTSLGGRVRWRRGRIGRCINGWQHHRFSGTTGDISSYCSTIFCWWSRWTFSSFQVGIMHLVICDILMLFSVSLWYLMKRIVTYNNLSARSLICSVYFNAADLPPSQDGLWVEWCAQGHRGEGQAQWIRLYAPLEQPRRLVLSQQLLVRVACVVQKNSMPVFCVDVYILLLFKLL